MSRVPAVIGAAMLAVGLALAFASSAAPVAVLAPPSVPDPATTLPAPTASASAATPFPAIAPGYRIQIPRLGIDLAILEGDIERDAVLLRTPENYAFHLPGTAIPGAGANSYLYAHARVGMFLSLWNSRVGDVVWISTPDGRALRYVVSEIHPRVPPDDVSMAAPSPPERLTLQTSTGPNPGDPRFIVIALPG
jgi:sortase (surface protein transpeptidase)